MTDEPLVPEEEARLAGARVPVPPPEGAEDRTVAALRERGLLRRPRRRLAVAWLAAAAAILVAVTWATVPRSGRAPNPAGPAGPRYVLMLYAGSEPIQGTADARRREYADWARGLASQGVAITGEELAEESRVVGGDAPSAAAVTPRGFFIVAARDLDAAQQIAATCPHLRYGGRIVIQPVV